MRIISSQKIFGVTEITSQIKTILERGNKFQQILVEGEISNLKVSGPGHLYFDLKDNHAQIKCVCFQNYALHLGFQLEDGNQVIVQGNLGVYEKRGQYNLYIESVEPQGTGSLQLAFEQLKSKLENEGLFEEKHKKPLPFLPQRIGIVTSPHGAAIHDILETLKNRTACVSVLIAAAKVQGQGAAVEIASAIKMLNSVPDLDIIIVTRGGGSIEDLWAFNEEAVARAIFASQIPVVSAVGHEVDVTISDFVADYRVPTPLAVAELIVSKQEDFLARLATLEKHLKRGLQLKFSQLRNVVFMLSTSQACASAQSKIHSQRQWLDELGFRLTQSSTNRLNSQRSQWQRAAEHLRYYDLNSIIELKCELVNHRVQQMSVHIHFLLKQIRSTLSTNDGALRSLSPLGVLNRGYAICRTKSGEILRETKGLKVGEYFSVTLSKGAFDGRVERIKEQKEI